jgi:serine/threonine-protein kinase
MGTPAYMAPEQHHGQAASVASDQFSFCVALFEALFGRRPYPGATAAAIVYSMEEGRIEPWPTGHPAPRWLYEALCRGLARDPADRFEDMDALLAELTSYRDTTLQVGKRARVTLVVAALAIVALVNGAASVCVRLYGMELSFRLVLIVSVVTVVGIGAALLALRREMTRSGMSEQLYGTFIAYLFFGPAMRLTGWLLGVAIPHILVFEAIGAGLFATLVALGFDRRLLRLIAPYFVWVALMVALPEWAFEMHALAHVGLFGAAAYIWVREGFAPLRAGAIHG